MNIECGVTLLCRTLEFDYHWLEEIYVRHTCQGQETKKIN